MDKHLIAYGGFSPEFGYRAMREILNSRAPFTAVLASKDESAVGVMQALQDAGKLVPQEAAVVGFDDGAHAHHP
jgi:DNA-binding LacI/PurR family transcriptional regulator